MSVKLTQVVSNLPSLQHRINVCLDTSLHVQVPYHIIPKVNLTQISITLKNCFDLVSDMLVIVYELYVVDFYNSCYYEKKFQS